MSRASLFSLAGFQVTFNGRFWVTAEAQITRAGDLTLQHFNQETDLPRLQRLAIEP